MQKPDDLSAELSLAGLCFLLSVSKQRAGQLEREGLVRRLGDNRYSIESVPAVIAHMREMVTSGGGSKAWNSARTSLAEERALAARQARLEREGRLVPADLINDFLLRFHRALRDRVLGIGVRIAPRLVHAKTAPMMQAIVDESTRGALEAICDDLRSAEVAARMQAEVAAKTRRKVPAGGVSDDDGDGSAAA